MASGDKKEDIAWREYNVHNEEEEGEADEDAEATAINFEKEYGSRMLSWHPTACT